MPQLLPVGDAALSVVFAEAYSPEAAGRAQALDRQLAALAEPGITECVPSLRALLIHYDPQRLSLRRLTALLESLPPAGAADAAGAAWSLPICYEGEYAPDLADLAARLSLSEAEIVAIHAGGRYHAAMVGGYPGYPYLAGLDARLRLPRRTTPRVAVPGGSLGIANEFTAIYPATVPGGWHILGRTPVPLFDPLREARPALVAAGDAIAFRPIPPAEFRRLDAEFRAGADPVELCRA
ncbi:5-oxoprolinase subunit PxpB [Roseococcus sp. YIM B11640]|uniref:5-oxoprolinase subunit PxpB n=1 Tax=Roseococcus sp. YIM B11640 TaxID=3133973 RepID=UPI003C7CC9F1